jgi:hypothetical protein
VRPARWAGSAAHAIANRLFDRACGSITSGAVQLSDLTIVDGGEHQDLGNRRYEGAAVLTCISLIRRLPADRGEYTFVVYGSGKGRVVLLAAALGFRRVIGIEFARELHEIARSNVLEFQRRLFWKKTNIYLHLGDAAQFELPQDKCIVFLYNPFPEFTLHEVLIRTEESYERNPREIYLVYLNPRFLPTLAKSAVLHLLADERFLGRRAAIFMAPGDDRPQLRNALRVAYPSTSL